MPVDSESNSNKKKRFLSWFSYKDLIWATLGAVAGKVIDYFFDGSPLFVISITSNYFYKIFRVKVWHILLVLAIVAIGIRFIQYKFGRGEMAKNRRMYKKIQSLVDKDDDILGVQLYQASLYRPLKSIKDKNFELKVKRLGGYSSSSIKTNCILTDGYVIPLDFVHMYKSILRDIKKMDVRIFGLRRTDLTVEFFFEFTALILSINDVINEIYNRYFARLNNIDGITPKHYFIYRFLFSIAETEFGYLQIIERMLKDGVITRDTPLTNEQDVALSRVGALVDYWQATDPDAELTQVLYNPEIESALRRKRTGYLSALIYDKLCCFSNTESLTKNGRCYFAVPYKKDVIRRVLTRGRISFMIVTYKEPFDKQKNEEINDCKNMSNRILGVMG